MEGYTRAVYLTKSKYICGIPAVQRWKSRRMKEGKWFYRCRVHRVPAGLERIFIIESLQEVEGNA